MTQWNAMFLEGYSIVQAVQQGMTCRRLFLT